MISKIYKGVQMYNLYLLSVVFIIQCRSSLLWVVACLAGIYLNIFFICGGDRVALIRSSEVKDIFFLRGGGQEDFLNNYPQVLHRFYFDFTFDWSCSFTLYNNMWTSFLHHIAQYQHKLISFCSLYFLPLCAVLLTHKNP